MRSNSEKSAINNNIPNDSTLDDTRYSLYVRSKIEKGLSDLANGKLISQEDLEKGMEKWLNE